MSATSSLPGQAAGALSPADRTHHFIAGRWREASGAPIAVIDAFTEATLAHVPTAGRPEVDDAVDAARRAFDEDGPGSWRSTTPGDRAEVLRTMANHLADRTDELSALAAREVGTPIDRARRVQVGLPVAVVRSIADLADMVGNEAIVGRSLVVKEPVGVVGAIGPWNYPLYQLVAKVAPALLAGCTVVAKPAMVAPLTAFALADAAEAAGLPAGVFNLVSGPGLLVGEALAGHPTVDMVSFTGSTSAGVRIGELAAASITRVALELGGKSACVVLDDADLVQAVGAAVASCFLNNGQTCVAQTRLLVPRHQFDEAEALARSLAEGFVLGDPLDPATTLGPLAGPSQLRSVRQMVADAIDRGARVVTGGAEPAAEPHGFFHRPTVLVPTGPEDAIAQEEVFGPVLSLLPYDGSDDSAVALANNSAYGLSGAVWSASPDRAEAVARRMRAGQVSVNGGAFDVDAPFGGYKRSGLGRELGPLGLEEFFEVKALLRPSP